MSLIERYSTMYCSPPLTLQLFIELKGFFKKETRMKKSLLKSKKNVVFLLCSLFTSTINFPILDLSPWIAVDNTTKLSLTCQIEAVYYRSDYEDENISIIANNNDDLTIKCKQEQNEDGNDFMHFTISFVCKPEQTSVFNPIFYEEDVMFNPQIKSVELTHESLQLRIVFNTTDLDQRYFTIKYDDDFGLIANQQAIPIYVKCLNNFKQTLRSIIIAALNAAQYLPY